MIILSANYELFRLDKIDPQKNLLTIKHKNHSIDVDYSLVHKFEDFIGQVYEVYGTIEKHEQTSEYLKDSSLFCSALLLNTVENADMKLLEQSIQIFNKRIYPEYSDIFI